jgi:polyphenol oxidase
VGRPELPVQIHFSWLFFPFHRAYVYFFERVAAKLLGDPGFAVPFWSWDVPEGMRIPPAFADEASPLYDPIRNPRHAPPRVVDHDY